MVQRTSIPAERDCTINVVTEQMPDGGWGVVASVTHHFGTSEQVTDLPVPSERFVSQADAEIFGVRMGQEWIAHNTPRAA